MNFWPFVGLVGWLFPVLLLWWRFKQEPRWAVVSRYFLAVALVWSVLLMLAAVNTDERIAAAEAANDIDGIIGDTGLNAAALLLGWIPGVCYVALLGSLRAVWLCAARRRALIHAA